MFNTICAWANNITFSSAFAGVFGGTLTLAKGDGPKVSGTAAGTAGRVRLTVDSTATMATGETWTVTNVSGTTEANGTWVITVIDATHVDLTGTVYVNAYVGGGTVYALFTGTGTVTGYKFIRDIASTFFLGGHTLPGSLAGIIAPVSVDQILVKYGGLYLYSSANAKGATIFNASSLTADRAWALDFGDQNCTLTLAGNTTVTAAAAGVVNQTTVANMRAALGLLSAQTITAASSAVSNTTTESKFDQSVTAAAGRLTAGMLVKIRWQGIATATNATDTLRIRVRIGGLTGTLLFDHAATDVANNDVFSGEFSLIVRTAGASGTIVGVGTGKSIAAAEGSATFKDDILASTTVDTTAAQEICVTATWSVANAGNSVRLDVLAVEYSF